jgi:hypothetical protein
MFGGDHDAKVDEILKSLDSQYQSSKNSALIANYFQETYDKIEAKYKQFCADNNWKDIVESIKGSEAYTIYDKNMKGWAKCIDFDMIRKNFVKTHGREPKIQEQKDMQYLMTKVMDFGKDYYLAHEADYKTAFDFLMAYGEQKLWSYSKEVRENSAYEAIKYYTVEWKQKLYASYDYAKNERTHGDNLKNHFRQNILNFQKILKEREELMKKWDSQ